MSRIASRDPAAVHLTTRLSRSDLLWVANTAHGPGGHWHARVRDGEPDHDHLESAESAMRYLRDHGVPIPDDRPDASALEELAVVRSMVRRMLVPGADPWTTEGRRLLDGADFRLGVDSRIREGRPGWPGFCRDLLLPLLGLVADRAELRSCSNPACRLIFQDGSRNHGRRWCDSAGCGNRDRVRRARGRQVRDARESAAPPTKGDVSGPAAVSPRVPASPESRERRG